MSNAAKTALLEIALPKYLKEFGDDGYDEVTFIDFVVTQVLGDGLAMPDKHLLPPFAPGLIEFYRKRANDIQKQFKLTDHDLELARRRHKARKRKQ